MRASETVSEASPGSTTSQTGVPTQVVQQVQATQQVGCTPPPGAGGEGTQRAAGAVAAGTWPSCSVLLPEPSADLFLPRCSLQPLLHPPGQAFLGKSHGSGACFLSLQQLLVQTSVQAKPGHVSPLQLTSIPLPQQVRPPDPAASPGCRNNALWPAHICPHQHEGHRPHPGATPPVPPAGDTCQSGPSGKDELHQLS